MVERERLYSLSYYKRNTFMGSDGIMNYRIHRTEQTQSRDADLSKASSPEPEKSEKPESEEEQKKEPIYCLEAICWRGPYIYDKTPEEQKRYAQFAYTQEGMTELVAWLNEQRQNMEEADQTEN